MTKMRNRITHTRNDASSSENMSIPPGNTHAPSATLNPFGTLVQQRNILFVMCITLLAILVLSHVDSSSRLLNLPSSAKNIHDGSSSCEINLGEYKGPVYHSVESGTIGKPRCLLNSKWLQVSLHTVKFPGSDKVYDDWMWVDYYDRVNVLVEDERKEGDEEPHFLVFEQTKYALEGRQSLAIIGGIMEAGEDPESTARREVEEEMDGLACQNFEFLGRHRSDVNRGMGWLNAFVATQCTRGPKTVKEISSADQIGAMDTEKQKLKSISLTELRQAVTEEKFIEVQWTATVAQALVKVYL